MATSPPWFPLAVTHVFDYTAVNLEERYTPPLLKNDLTITQYTCNRDKQLDLVTRPDGQTLDLSYNAGGRLESLVTATSRVNYTITQQRDNLQPSRRMMAAI